MTADTRTAFCTKCERELDDQGHCPKHWPEEFKKLTDFRRQSTVNKVATRTPVAEDLLTVLASPIGRTVERLLDALAGLAAASSAGKAMNLDSIRSKSQHAPLPGFEPAWADLLEQQLDDRLWEIAEDLSSFLNRPTDPKRWSACTTCGNKRLGDSSYCQNCGARILAGARRCRVQGCPNQGSRRSHCPTTLPSSVDGLTVMVPHP